MSEDPNIPTDAKASSTETENTGISKLFHSLQDTVSHSLSDTLGKFRAGQSTSVTEENTDNETLLRSLSELTETDASARGLVRSVLSEDARSSFAALLSKLPVSPSFFGSDPIRQCFYSGNDACTQKCYPSFGSFITKRSFAIR